LNTSLESRYHFFVSCAETGCFQHGFKTCTVLPWCWPESGSWGGGGGAGGPVRYAAAAAGAAAAAAAGGGGAVVMVGRMLGSRRRM